MIKHSGAFTMGILRFGRVLERRIVCLKQAERRRINYEASDLNGIRGCLIHDRNGRVVPEWYLSLANAQGIHLPFGSKFCGVEALAVIGCPCERRVGS
jgi:hypothetical protein